MRARAVDAAFFAALLLVAAASLWPVYEQGRVLAVIGGGVVVGGGVAALGARFRWPGWAVAGATALALALVGAPLAVPGGTVAVVVPTPDGLGMLASGAVFGWKDMLSVPLPLGDYGALLMPALLVVAAAAAAGFSLVLRSSCPAWALAAAAAVFLFGLAFGGHQPLWPVLLGILFVVVALLWATRGIGMPRGGRARPRRFLAATAVIAATAGAGAGIAAVLPATASRTVIRDAVTSPFDPRAELSPLVAYRNSVLPPGAETVMLRVGGLPEGSRLRLAVLDDYDGRVFAVGTDPASGAYERISLRVVRPVAPEGRSARVAVTVEDYRGSWLPTAGAVESITLDGFFYNSTAGAGAVAGEVGKGTRYTMRTVIEGMSEDASIAAAVPPGAGSGVSSIPASLADAVGRHAGDGSPGARLLALTTWLRAGYTSHGGEGEPPSRSGHSVAWLSELVDTEPMVGDAEQYAPALALMARQLGFPSRVVVGYEPTGDRVTGADLTAWVEVRTADGHWLAIDPNPPEREAPEDDRESTKAIALPETVLPPPPPTRPDAVSSTGSAGDDKKPEPELPEWLRTLNAVLGIAAVAGPALAALLAPLWLPALLRGVLRGRRRRKDRRERVLTGGWSQVRDRIAELGESVPRAATRQEVAAIARSAEVMVLAARADRVAFDAYEPTQAEVDAYWVGVRRARSVLLRAHGVRTRVRVMMSWRGILSGVKGRRRCQ